jgi:hypothetical protein
VFDIYDLDEATRARFVTVIHEIEETLQQRRSELMSIASSVSRLEEPLRSVVAEHIASTLEECAGLIRVGAALGEIALPGELP